jgi:hypothetical protein
MDNDVEAAVVARGMKIVQAFLHNVATSKLGRCVYRGHANTAWQAIPSTYREGQSGISEQIWLDGWKKAAARFGSAVQTDLEWLVLAQHYGVNTCLLDWSTNPLVALYFAAQSTRSGPLAPEVNGRVLALPIATVTPETALSPNDLFNTISAAPILIDSARMNPRTSAQDSVMTFHRQSNAYPVDTFNWAFFEVEGGLKPAILAALKVLGVSSDRIFADISGVARDYAQHVADQVELNKFFGMRPTAGVAPASPPTK